MPNSPVTIRRIQEKDLPDLCELLADERVMRYLEPPFSQDQTAQFLNEAGLSDHPPLIYAAEANGSFIGYVIFHDFDPDSLEIGWVLDPSVWGKGYACALTELMLEKAQAYGKDTVIECAPDQEVTKHIAQKYGFTFYGNCGGCDLYRRSKND